MNSSTQAIERRRHAERIAHTDLLVASQLRERADISYRQLDHWSRIELLKPVTELDGGSGDWRFFPPAEVRAAIALGWCARVGIAVRSEVAALIVQAARDDERVVDAGRLSIDLTGLW